MDAAFISPRDGFATLEARRSELDSLFSDEPDLGRVFDRLMDFVRDFAGRGRRWNEVIILKREQKNWEEKERKFGTTRETGYKKNELLAHAMELVEVVASEAIGAAQEDQTPIGPPAAIDVDRATAERSDSTIEEAREEFRKLRQA